MTKLPGVNHLDAIRALGKAGFRIIPQGKHVVMSDKEKGAALDFLTFRSNRKINIPTIPPHRTRKQRALVSPSV